VGLTHNRSGSRLIRLHPPQRASQYNVTRGGTKESCMILLRLILTLIQAVVRVSVAALEAGMSLIGLAIGSVAALGALLFALTGLGVLRLRRRRK
jgi:hypothetical protein